MTGTPTPRPSPAPAAGPAAPEPARALRAVPLGDLAVAPENLRAGEPPDAEIPQLAAAIRAAGVLLPLTVRPGGRREKPAMVLDGRRRLLALQALCAAGDIGPDHPVPCFEETDPARQAAAAVLTNTAAPVHVADVIAAIGKMLKARLTPAAVAAALGYAETEVRRLAALAALHPKALAALKAGRINLRQARLLARLPDRKEQGELAGAALQGFGFQEWRVCERLDAGQATAEDRRLVLVGAARYAAAGGRTEADLFGERPAVLLDPDLLQGLWSERAGTLAGGLAGEGRTVITAVEPAPPDPALAAFGQLYGAGLDPAQREAWRDAQAFAEAAAAALEGLDLADPAQDAAIAAFLQARLAADQAGEPGRAATHVVVFASRRTGLDLRAYGPDAPEPDAAAAADPGAEGGPGAGSPPAGRPLAPAPEPLTEGVGHALHETRTDAATRALARALADDPPAALAVLAARLFSVLVLRRGLGKGDSALTVRAEPFGRPGREPIAALDGAVRARLAERRAAFEASGLSVLGWAAGLPAGEAQALLAELTALSLDLREERANAVRPAARAEAAEIAALCRAEVTRWWTPDAAYLRAHAKPQLLAMLQAMGASEPADAGRRKDELVERVAAEAARRRWAPPELSWLAGAAEAAADVAAAA